MPLPTEYQSFIHLSRYARWDYDKKRRETWEETVNRYFDFFAESIIQPTKCLPPSFFIFLFFNPLEPDLTPIKAKIFFFI